MASLSVIRALSVCVVSAGLSGCFLHGVDVFDLMNTAPRQQPRSTQATFCDVMNAAGGPIRWSKSDTRLTKEQADRVNAAGVDLCGWGKRK
jgi:hypothetical protein